MHENWMLLILSFPFVVILVCMIGLRWSALKAGLVALVATLAIVPVFLDVSLAQVRNDILPRSMFEAAVSSLSILWIIFGALCIYYAQLHQGAIARIQQQLQQLHPNPKVSALFVAWFFSMFMEGAAGFGTSAALTAPFLVAAGYRPVIAVVLALWGHSLGVAFGAVGTPVITQSLLVYGAAAPDMELLLSQAVLPYLIPTTFVLAIGLAWGCTRFHVSYAGQLHAALYKSAAGLGTLAALCFLLPAVAVAYFLGPELPTLLGAVVGAALFSLLLRSRRGEAADLHVVAQDMSFARATAPYAVLILLVLVTRLVPEVKATLMSVQWTFEWRGYQGMIPVLYHPGTLLVVSFVVGGLLQRQSAPALLSALVLAAKRVLTVLAPLFIMLLLSRVLVHGGAINQLGQQVAIVAGAFWPFWAPWFGVLGTFITGSATSSNILFSEFQRSAAEAGGHESIGLLGSQTIGAAIGNMVCPHNIIAAGATVNIQGNEGQVMKYTFPMAAILTTIAGVVALGWV
ncbi:MAG: L-lactate permease [Idiomarina sp.]|nr:L-lactate permease [Idiomarina sp.]